MSVRPVPEGFSTLTPYLVTSDGARMIAFLQQAFGAEVTFRKDEPDGRISHAELRVIDAMLMLGQAPTREPRPATFYVYVADCDAVYARALAAGAVVDNPIADREYGDRNGGVRDFDGNLWYVASRRRVVQP